MSHYKFKKGDIVRIKTIYHTQNRFNHTSMMYNIGDIFKINEVINEYEIWDEKQFAYHPDDLELVTDEILKTNNLFNLDKFLAHLNLQIIKN